MHYLNHLFNTSEFGDYLGKRTINYWRGDYEALKRDDA